VDLWEDTEVVGKHVASIFRVEVCKFRNKFCYDESGHDPKRRGEEERNPVLTNGKKRTSGSIKAFIRGTLVYRHRWECNSGRRRTFLQIQYCFQGEGSVV
jgi:hypothetical protein